MWLERSVRCTQERYTLVYLWYWAVVGDTGLYWAILGCTGLYWAVLGYIAVMVVRMITDQPC